jgi:hypothetical protein
MKRVVFLIAVCLLGGASQAGASIVVGPDSLPIGIDNLSITYSGGTALFNVRFDERPFNDVYGSGTPNLPFITEADVAAAMTALHGVLPFTTLLGSTPTYDSAPNNAVYYPLEFDDDDVSFIYLVQRAPSGWQNRGREDYALTRDGNFDFTNEVWARFTPTVPEPSSATAWLLLTALVFVLRRRASAASL